MSDPLKIAIDAELVRRLDRWRGETPSLNRTALVNYILLEWISDKEAASPRRRLSQING